MRFIREDNELHFATLSEELNKDFVIKVMELFSFYTNAGNQMSLF